MAEEKTMYPRYRWFVCFVMFIVIAVNAGLVLIGPAPLVGEISKATQIPIGTVTSVMMSSFTFFVFLGCISSAFLIDKIGVAKVFIIASALTTVGAVLMPTMGNSLGGILFLRLLQGLGAGLCMATPAQLSSEWFSPDQRGIVMGIFGASIGIGTAIGSSIFPAIFNSVGSWTATIAWSGVATICALILSLVFFFGPQVSRQKKQDKTTDAQAATIADGNETFKKILRESSFWIFLVITFIFSWIQQGYSSFIPGYLAVKQPMGLGLGSQTGGQLFSYYSLAFTVGGLVGGFASSLLFKNKLKIGIAFAYILSGLFNISVLLPDIGSHSVRLSIFLIIAGFFLAWANVMTFAYLTECFPANVMGKTGGLVQGGGILGAPIGISIGALLLNSNGSYTATLLIFGVLGLLGFICSFLLKKSRTVSQTKA